MNVMHFFFNSHVFAYVENIGLLKYDHMVIFHTMKVNGDWSCQALKISKNKVLIYSKLSKR